MTQAAVDAMVKASRHNVDLAELQAKIGAKIAALTKNEAAYVSCGAASGIMLALATCMAGTNPVLSEQLPNTTGMRNRVVMHAADRGYKADVAIRSTGAAIVNVGDAHGATEDQFHFALNDTTAAILIVDNGTRNKVPIDRLVPMAKERGIPLIVDAAGSLPPVDAFWRFTRDLGADAVIVSGGKGLRGPQSTGLVLGTKRLVEGCRFHGNPNNRIGRGMKVGKEELVGIYAAVQFFLQQDHAEIQAERTRQIEYVAGRVSEFSRVKIQRRSQFSLYISIDGLTNRSDYARWASRLLDDMPAVYAGYDDIGLIVSSECFEPGEEMLVAAQLRKLMSQ
jgi:L-seryl-tRNA(Ser) seleniumtransferase